VVVISHSLTIAVMHFLTDPTRPTDDGDFTYPTRPNPTQSNPTHGWTRPMSICALQQHFLLLLMHDNYCISVSFTAS